MEEKRSLNAVEKLQKLVTWCDCQNDDFTAMFKTIGKIEKCYDACRKHGVEFADNLTWDKDDPNYIKDPKYLLAKDVNEILGVYHYKVGELTISMLSQAKKDFVELLHELEDLPFSIAYRKFEGYNRQGRENFDCNYKSISVTVERSIDGCTLLPTVEIWDDKHIISFNERFDELLYGHGYGCLAIVDDDLFTREIDPRDVLGLEDLNFDIGSYALRDYLKDNPEKEEELRENGWLPKVFVPDDIFDGDYFSLVEEVRIVLFLMYEDFVTCEPKEILDDYRLYTGVEVKSLSDIDKDGFNKFIKGVDDYGIKWREEVLYRIL